MSASIQSLLVRCNQRIRLLEAHDRESFRTVNTAVSSDGQRFQGVWISSLTQTTYLGIPDTELVSPLKRASLLPWLCGTIQEKDHPPLAIVFDCDSGGDAGEIHRLVEVLVKLGVSMIVIEDKSVNKPGDKVNSIHGASHCQPQADMYEFANVIKAFVAAASIYAEGERMIITARIESFTVRVPEDNHMKEEESFQNSLRDALMRAELYKRAGANAIMIHSKSAQPNEVLAFLARFRSQDATTPVVLVPTTYSSVTEDILYAAGANVIIYANHLMRAKLHAMRHLSDEESERRQQAPNPSFSQNEALKACVAAQNFGCLLQKLGSSKDLNEAAAAFLNKAEKQVTRTMAAVGQSLLRDRSSGAADSQLIAVRDLLEINSRQIFSVETL